MRKNKFALFIALLLVIIIPTGAFASAADVYKQKGLEAGKEQVVNIQLGTKHGLFANQNGEDGVADFLKAIGIEARGLGKNQFGLNLLLNAAPELTFLVNTDEEGKIFVEIPQLQAPVLEITPDDIFSFMEKNGQAMSDMQKQAFGAALTGSGLAKMEDGVSNKGMKLNLEELKNPQKTGDEVLDKWTLEKTASMQFVENPKGSDKHDKAVMQISFKLNNEDLLVLFTSKTVQDIMAAQIEAMKNSEGTSFEESQDFEAVMKQGMEFYADGTITLDATYNYYIDAEGYLVAMEVPIAMKIDAEKMEKATAKDIVPEAIPEAEKTEVEITPQQIDMALNYYRLTNSDEYVHSIELPVKAEEINILNFDLEVKVPVNETAKDYYVLKGKLNFNDTVEQTSMTLDVLSDNIWNGNKAHGLTAIMFTQEGMTQGISIDVNTEVSEENGITSELEFFAKGGAQESYNHEISENDMKVFTLNINEKFVEPTDFFEAQPAKAKNTVRILTLSDEDMNKFIESIQPALQNWIGGLMKKLPATFLNVVMPQAPAQ